MKLSTINKILVVIGILVLITGLILHFDYHRLIQDHAVHAFWSWSHIILAALLIILATFHMIKNNWWFKSLKYKTAKTRTKIQRMLTPTIVLLFLSLIATGLCMICGWYPRHSHIWTWHFGLGIAWAVIAICHGIAFHRPKPVPNATQVPKQ